MLLEQAGKKPIQFLSSVDSNLEEHPNEDLLRLTYRRAQPQSPEFLTTYEGIDQAADIQISTIILRAAPEPLLFFYDFIMATFVPRSQLPTSESQQEVASSQVSLIDQQPSGSKIKILIKMARIRGQASLLFSFSLFVLTTCQSFYCAMWISWPPLCYRLRIFHYY